MDFAANTDIKSILNNQSVYDIYNYIGCVDLRKVNTVVNVDLSEFSKKSIEYEEIQQKLTAPEGVRRRASAVMATVAVDFDDVLKFSEMCPVKSPSGYVMKTAAVSLWNLNIAYINDHRRYITLYERNLAAHSYKHPYLRPICDEFIYANRQYSKLTDIVVQCIKKYKTYQGYLDYLEGIRRRELAAIQRFEEERRQSQEILTRDLTVIANRYELTVAEIRTNAPADYTSALMVYRRDILRPAYQTRFIKTARMIALNRAFDSLFDPADDELFSRQYMILHMKSIIKTFNRFKEWVNRPVSFETDAYDAADCMSVATNILLDFNAYSRIVDWMPFSQVAFI